MYNPFRDRQLSDLDADDLRGLIEREVAEGYYVEYKSSLISARNLAKSISAFANSRGGWLFLGIESDKETNAAIRLTGIDLSRHRDVPDLIRNAVVGHLDPTPPYYPRLIPLADQLGIAVVQVPEGDTPPYIHSDGRIYRRQGAGSDPVFESDRHTIDQLYAKGEKLHARFLQFASLPWELTRGQADDPPGWAEVYIMPEHPTHMTTDEQNKAFELLPEDHLRWWSSPVAFRCGENNKPSIAAGSTQILFDQCHTSLTGYSVSQTLTSTDATRLSLTVDVGYEGAACIFIPLESLPEEVERSAREALSQTWGDAALSVTIFDGDALCRAVFAMLLKCASYAQHCGVSGRVRTKIRLANIWRCVPCFTDQAFMDMTCNVGWPVSRRDEIEIPSPLSAAPFLVRELDPHFHFALGLTVIVLQAVGIPVAHATGIIVNCFRSRCDGDL